MTGSYQPTSGNRTSMAPMDGRKMSGRPWLKDILQPVSKISRPLETQISGHIFGFRDVLEHCGKY